MTERTSALAVIHTQLPYVDRRALSQAWFSALHLAEREPARRVSVSRPQAQVTRGAANDRHAGANASPARPEVCRGASGSRQRVESQGEVPGPTQSRRAERKSVPDVAPRTRSYRALHASFALGENGGRVHLVLRRRGGTLQVIALCAAHQADAVRRALAHAELRLRAAGERIETCVRGTQCGGDAA